MLLYFTSRLVSSTVAFIYPGYASYKVLSQRPASEADLERWLMYWSVLGCMVGVEYVAEWLISWIPLYYPIKTLFLLYLALPQTRGSSFIYVAYLQPFFRSHESDIDAALASLKSRAYLFIQERAKMAWDWIMAMVAQSGGPNPNATPAAAPPPTMNDPVSGPVQMLGGLWRQYGPSIVASGAALLHQSQAQGTTGQPAASSGTGFFSGFAPSTSSVNLHSADDTQSVLERRRQLEAELASLSGTSSAHDQTPPAFPIPTTYGSSAYGGPNASPNNSSGDLRARTTNSSPAHYFEEVEVPSDVEGYDVGDGLGPSRRPHHPSTPSQGQRPDGGRRTSWFGLSWGSPSTQPADGSLGAVPEKPKGE